MVFLLVLFELFIDLMQGWYFSRLKFKKLDWQLKLAKISQNWFKPALIG